MSALKTLHAVQRARSQQGAAAVELAIVLVVLVLLAAGVVEFGRALWYYDAMAKGTRDAARYLSTVPLDQLKDSRAQAVSLVVAAGTNANVPNVSGTVTAACDAPAPANCDAPKASDINTITVSVAYPFTLGEWIPFVPPSSRVMQLTLRPHTTMRYMW